jgi:hypothetical protein
VRQGEGGVAEPDFSLGVSEGSDVETVDDSLGTVGVGHKPRDILVVVHLDTLGTLVLDRLHEGTFVVFKLVFVFIFGLPRKPGRQTKNAFLREACAKRLGVDYRVHFADHVVVDRT